MKKEIYVAMLSLLSMACTKDDEASPINGKWKLLEARYYGFQSERSAVYSNQNIVYNFQANNILIVSGGDNAGYPEGEYQYFYGEGYLSGIPEANPILIVEINDAKWEFGLTNGTMTLGQTYVDGPILIFERP